MKKLINELIKDSHLNAQIKEIINLEKLIKLKTFDYPQLKWTISQYRKFLEQTFLKRISNLAMPNYIIELMSFKLSEKIDLILPPSIGEYFLSDWTDTTLVANVFLKRLKIERKIKNWGWIYINCVLNQKNSNNVITNNKKILSSNKSLEPIIENLQSRLILAAFGGIENINNIDVVKYQFTPNGLIYENNQQNYIERQYLRINVKDNNKLNEYNHLLWYGSNDFLFYKKFLANSILGSNILNLDTDNNNFEKSINKIANDEKNLNNYLILINNIEKNHQIINDLITESKNKNHWQLQNKCLDIVIKNTYEQLLNEFISQFEQIMFWLSTNYMQFCLLKSKVRRQIRTAILNANVNIINYDDFQVKLFNRVRDLVEEVE